MSSRAFHKRTFGIENEEFLIYSVLACFVIFVVHVLSLSIEFILMISKSIPSSTSNDFENFIAVLHFVGFLVMVLIVIISFLARWKEWKSHKSAFRKMASFTVFTIIYLYNPWIVAYQVKAVEFYDIFKYTTIGYTCSSLIFSVACLFSTFILWRMSRIEADYEPCEVIYGGEDSETKKLMGHYE